jgi:hypothetical protein
MTALSLRPVVAPFCDRSPFVSATSVYASHIPFWPSFYTLATIFQSPPVLRDASLKRVRT